MKLTKKLSLLISFILIKFNYFAQSVGGNRYYYYALNDKKDDESFNPLGLIIFSAIVAVIYLAREVYFNPQKYLKFRPFNNRTNMSAHVILGIKMIQLDRTTIKGQVNYLITFNKRLFPDYNIKYEYNKIVGSKLNIDPILKWYAKKSDDEDKIDLLDYLADLAYFGHRATAREINMLRHVANIFEVDGDVLGSILTIREQRYERKQQRNHSYNNRVSKTNSIKNALSILALDKNPSEGEIKKAYRKMAKKFHPDRYQNKSVEEQNMAHERFVEINKAYDYLLNNI